MAYLKDRRNLPEALPSRLEAHFHFVLTTIIVIFFLGRISTRIVVLFLRIWLRKFRINFTVKVMLLVKNIKNSMLQIRTSSPLDIGKTSNSFRFLDFHLKISCDCVQEFRYTILHNFRIKFAKLPAPIPFDHLKILPWSRNLDMCCLLQHLSDTLARRRCRKTRR